MSNAGPEPIVVLGSGGHGRETVCLIRETEARTPGRWNLLGVASDDEPDVALLDALGVRWLGSIECLRMETASVSIAVGDGRRRLELQGRARALGCRSATLIHPAATVGLDVEMGEGCYIGALTVVTSHARLGDGVQVNVSCSLSHDVVIGDFVTLSPGVHLAGGVVVEDGATIYTGASVLPHVRVGRGAVVGAGAVVIRDVSNGERVVGVPATAVAKE